MREYSKEEILELGKKVKYCRDCGMRWCLIEKQMKMSVSELKRILCLYNDATVFRRTVTNISLHELLDKA